MANLQSSGKPAGSPILLHVLIKKIHYINVKPSNQYIVSDLEYMVQWIWLSIHQVQIYFLNYVLIETEQVTLFIL